MRFVMAGASGFLGGVLTRHLTGQGHEVVRLVRRTPQGADEAQWDPYAAEVDQAIVDGADVVVNLAGAPLAHWPWTESYKREFLESRVITTRVLAEAVARSTGAPVLLAQSGVAGYGDRGAEVITEDTPTDGDTFIAEVTRQWELSTVAAEDAGSRVVHLRTGVVLDKSGGALKAMLPAFRLGVGGPIGSGRQYFATISLDDWLGATTFLAERDDLSGAFNLTGPQTTTNRDFTKELGRALHRPTVLRVPAFPLRSVGGVAGNELLSSARVEPRRLLDAGYRFAHPDLTSRVAAALD